MENPQKENEIPDPEVLNQQRAEDTSARACVKRMILDKAMAITVRCIQKAHAAGRFVVSIDCDRYRNPVEYNPSERESIFALFPRHSKGYTEEDVWDYVHAIVNQWEAFVYVRAKLKAKSPLYRVEDDKEGALAISWAQ